MVLTEDQGRPFVVQRAAAAVRALSAATRDQLFYERRAKSALKRPTKSFKKTHLPNAHDDLLRRRGNGAGARRIGVIVPFNLMLG
jgi:hypothetical protein